MISKILIFRTDQIGDLLATLPAILTIKNKIKDSKITLVVSEKNYSYAKSFNIFDEIYLFPKKAGIFKRALFTLKLLKKKFEYVFILDGKDRSIICSLFINSRKKVAVFSKKKSKFFFKIFNIKFIDDDEKTSLQIIFQNAINCFFPDTKISFYNFLKYKKNNNFSSQISIRNYIHIHLDEKWVKELYIKNYTDINPKYNDFVDFLYFLANEKKNILITTGLIDFKLIKDLKENFFEKINNSVYFKKISNSIIYFVYKPTLDDFESLIRESKVFISCHCGLTHAPNSFGIKIIDIIEKNRIEWYSRYTFYLKNYKQVYRGKFSEIKQDLINNIIY